MPSRTPAALKGLYGTPTTAGRSRKFTYRDLGNSDMKALVRVLRGVPFPTNPEADKNYVHSVKDKVHDLPSHLRSSSFHRSSTEDKETGQVKAGCLCSVHKGLKAGLIWSIWEWIRHELDEGIGHFIYPVIMHGGLTELQKWKARQLEPVLEMYHLDYNMHQAAPPDHEPIGPGWIDKHGKYTPKFSWQTNQCPGCALARMGSDADVVAALLTGIVARLSPQEMARRSNVKSKRVRFVRYWLKAFDGGSKLVDEAWDLAEELKRTRKEWKTYVRSQKGSSTNSRGTWPQPTTVQESLVAVDDTDSFDPQYRPPSPTPCSMPRVSTLPRNDSESVIIALDTSEPHNPPTNPYQFHLAPPPIPTSPRPTSSIYSRTTGGATLRPTVYRGPTMLSQHTLPDPPVHHTQRSQANLTEAEAHSIHSQQARYSIASSLTSSRACSWSHMPSYVDTPLSQAHDQPELRPAPLRTSNTSREAAREDLYKLPQPNRMSMYAGFGNPYGEFSPHKTDKFGGMSPPGTPRAGGTEKDGAAYDVSPPASPRNAPATGATRWGQFYDMID